jgi:RNA polymerase sigma-70 factor (ECF subfamily)
MDLLNRFKEGDLVAFEALFRQYQAEVYGWILRIVRDPGVAEDLTVETFWRIYRARTRFSPQAAFGAWARRIATNLAIDHLRQRRPEVELSHDGHGHPHPIQLFVRRCVLRSLRRFADCR